MDVYCPLKRTKHIKAKFFLIKDYYDAGEVDVKFCPTDESAPRSPSSQLPMALGEEIGGVAASFDITIL